MSPSDHDISIQKQIDLHCNEFEEKWSPDKPSQFKTFLARIEKSNRAKLLVCLIEVDIELSLNAGLQVDPNDYRIWGPKAVKLVSTLLAERNETSDEKTDATQTFEGQEISTDIDEGASDTKSPNDRVIGSLPEQFGRYRIVRRLGAGAMGDVFLAYDTKLERNVALKTPSFHGDDNAELIERFYREARAAANFRHPNICPVYEVGAIDGRHYISMAFISGKPLSEFVKSPKPLNQKAIAITVRKLAQALQHAHEAGIVHRDLKPANIMVDEHRQPLVMDFGIALQLDDEKSRMTRGGAVLGTPAYMAPEQIKGQLDLIGTRSDIYSLGIVLYELLTGQLPFKGTFTHVVSQILTESPKPPSEIRNDVDPRLEAICLKMIAKSCEDRYETMKEVDKDLAKYSKGSSAEFLPKSSVEIKDQANSRVQVQTQDREKQSAKSFFRYYAAASVASLAMLVLLSVIFFGSNWRGSEESPSPKKVAGISSDKEPQGNGSELESKPSLPATENVSDDAEAQNIEEEQGADPSVDSEVPKADPNDPEEPNDSENQNQPALTESPLSTTSQNLKAEDFAANEPAQLVPTKEIADADSSAHPNVETVVKAAVPDEEAIANSISEFNSIFKDRVTNAKTAIKKHSLAKELLQLAKKTTSHESDRYVLLDMATKLAIEAQVPELALESTSLIAASYDVDEFSLLRDTLISSAGRFLASTSGRKSKELKRQRLIDHLDRESEKALKNDRYAIAIKLSETMRDITENEEKKRTILLDIEKAERKKASFEEFQWAETVVDTDPNNSKANEVIGRWHCFEKQDWEQGLSFLARSEDLELSALAQKDLDLVAGGDNYFAVANSWWDLAEKNKQVRDSIRERSGIWYAKALGKESGLNQRIIDLRLAILETAPTQALLNDGRTPEGEEAIQYALKWLADHQLPDGGWNFDHRIGPGNHRTAPYPGTLTEARNGATAIALLPFLSIGQTHIQGDYKNAVQAGLEFLMSRAKRSGRGLSYHESGGTMFSHGLVSIVFCEAFARTKDTRLLPYAQGTVWFIEDAQDKIGGGWGVQPKMVGDMKTTAWQISALRSARKRGLDVNKHTNKLATKFLDSMQLDGGTKYGSPTGGRVSLRETSAGLLSRHYLEDAFPSSLVEGLEWISDNGPSFGGWNSKTDRELDERQKPQFDADMYHNYHASRLIRRYGGDRWRKWNEQSQDFLVSTQAKKGASQGSWFFYGSHSDITEGGRLYTTALAALTLSSHRESSLEIESDADSNSQRAVQAAMAAARKMGIPLAEEIKESQAQVEQLFGHRISSAKTSIEKESLAREMFSLATQSIDELSDVYALLDAARKVSIASANVDLCFEAIWLLEDWFGIDSLSLRSDVLLQLTEVEVPYKSDRERVSNRDKLAWKEQLVKLLSKEAATALYADRFDIAFKLLETAQEEKIPKWLSANVENQIQAAKELNNWFNDTETARKLLETEPENSSANETLGIWYCFQKEDWEKGLPYLAKAENRDLKGAANDDLALAVDEKNFVVIANNWSDLIDKYEQFRIPLVKRASFWFNRALDVETGLSKERIKRRLDEIRRSK